MEHADTEVQPETRKQTQRQTVLIVDDSQMNVTALAELLRDRWLVKVARTGADALRIAHTRPQPDIVLLDIMMPEMDGYEVCRQLKASGETRDIPVIFITALDHEDSEEHGLTLGAIDYITKPFSPALVKARVKNHLELKRYRDILKNLSMIDGLTELANRRRFEQQLASEWQRALRKQTPLSVVMLDIDHFKEYNDFYGHVGGDDCLRQIAAVLKNRIKRSADLAARWGGEEFACLLPETEHAAGFTVAEELRAEVYALGLAHEGSHTAPVVTISAGVATVTPDADSGAAPELLVEQADRALYAAKESGRNRVMPGA